MRIAPWLIVLDQQIEARRKSDPLQERLGDVVPDRELSRVAALAADRVIGSPVMDHIVRVDLQHADHDLPAPELVVPGDQVAHVQSVQQPRNGEVLAP